MVEPLSIPRRGVTHLHYPPRAMSSVKGSAVSARTRFVRERFGDAGLARLLDVLEPDHRARIERGLLAHDWVPFDLFVAVNVEADRLFGKGDLALALEMGRYAAEVNLPTLYKIFYRFGSPLYIFQKAARLWEVHYDSGKLIPVAEGQKAARMRILDFAHPHRSHCLSVLGWATRSIELSGATVEEAEEIKCRTRGDSHCEMFVRWR
jgi:hypothetical protein